MKNNKVENGEVIKEFESKVWELKNANDFQENGESGIYEFGYKVKVGNEVFTIVDWGNIEKFFLNTLTEFERETKERIKLCAKEQSCSMCMESLSQLEKEKRT